MGGSGYTSILGWDIMECSDFCLKIVCHVSRLAAKRKFKIGTQFSPNWIGGTFFNLVYKIAMRSLKFFFSMNM
jgi:hypothetical protein